MKMLDTLRTWQQHDWIRAIDVGLAEYIYQHAEPRHEGVAALAGLVSHQLAHGHPCLDLSQLFANARECLLLPPEYASSLSRQECPEPHLLLQQASADEWQHALNASTAVNTDNSPLVFDGQRLYLRRYWQYEQWIKDDLEQRMTVELPINVPQLKATLDDLFGITDKLSWQRVACAMATRSLFTIVTGGPGTGKTYTVVRLLATLQRLRETEQPLTIRLAAPTGKAAARMSEAISNELETLQSIDDVKHLITTEAVTLHRLLGTQAHSRGFRHHAGNQIHADVLIIDEASMVDIEMLAAVIQALPSTARLILLGDKDQLASVEAGAILGQLCSGAEAGGYSTELVEWLNSTNNVPIPDDKTSTAGALKPYLQHTVMLHESRRFDAEKGIGKLAHEINHQQTAWLKNWLVDSAALAASQPEFNNIAALAVNSPKNNQLRQLVIDELRPLMALIAQRPAATANEHEFDQWAEQILLQLGAFQLLVAIRQGDWGLHALNELVTFWLYGDSAHATGWFAGRPVMVTHNDYSLDLRNGDMGIALQRRDDEPLRVAFQSSQGSIRWVLPSRLTQVDTAYAMTIHKSQGSEFGHTVMVLPDRDTPILTKELLYTGVTRAKSQFTLVAAQPDLTIKAVQRRISRSGAL